MLFADYTFEVLNDGTIIMDKELKPSSVKVKTGDQYVAHVTFDERIIFQKVQQDGRDSGINQ
jgi:hypothetical protein